MVLSLVPVCATIPDDRLLFLAGLGCMGLLAQLFGAWWEKNIEYTGSKIFYIFRNVLIIILIFVHIIIEPSKKICESRFYQKLRPYIDKPASDRVLKPEHEDQVVFILNPPGSFIFYKYAVYEIWNQNNHFYKNFV